MGRTMGHDNEGKQVRMSENVTVRLYPRTLGDSPCSEGPPVSISWQPQMTETRKLEIMEYMRMRRNFEGRGFFLSKRRRTQILLDAGFSKAEISKAIAAATTLRAQREETAKKQGWSRAQIRLVETGKLPRGILNGVAALPKGFISGVASLLLGGSSSGTSSGPTTKQSSAMKQQRLMGARSA